MNKVCLTGRLGKDPELKKTPNDISVLSFSITVSGDYNANTKERPTYWINCLAWRGTAEFIARNFFKGSAIEICGKLQTRNWTDKNGNNRESTEVVISDVAFCIGGVKSDGQALTEIEDTEEYLPF